MYVYACACMRVCECVYECVRVNICVWMYGEGESGEMMGVGAAGKGTA